MSESTPQGTTDTTQVDGDATDTDATTTTTTPDLPPEAAAAVEAAQKEAEKWQALARKHEQRAKENAGAAKALDEVKRAQMSDQERLVAEARAAERATVLVEVGSKLVDAEFKAAAAGRTVNGQPLDLGAVLEGVNRAFYLTDDGEVDTAKVTRFIDGIAPKQDDSHQQQPRYAADLGQGKRTSGARSTADQFAGAVEQFLR